MVAKTVAIIPARGGSKRIPKKNIVDFLGEPMISKTIQAALKSGCFDKVVVSTDSQEIADVAKKYGAEVPFLRNEYADDVSPVSDVIINTLKQLESLGYKYDNVVSLMPNCPLRDSDDILQMYKVFEKEGYDFLLSAFSYGYTNPWWAHLKSGNEYKPLFPEQIQKRSQDLEELLCPSGAIWIADVKKLYDFGSFYGKGYAFHELSYFSAVDIDDFDDLALAKAFYLVRKGSGECSN
ncbi:acylneuraminate cytidylyltransferase family protein [Francisella philomiragia]|uniref:acylneuraminate cytidylyltransferase family protein n=1 Tax=Francisella philomiragia TaxID=28110 RepID=UPI000B58BDA0|nr:acylneuraminate cytidylyltransferase family protein [Francisella philomiragia]MBK2095897.1 acylneuraminate cytidylyltransferase family protein [Francisella philomiragia]